MLIALVLTVLSSLSCKFLSYKVTSVIQPVPLPEPFVWNSAADVGFFRYAITSNNESCEFYDFTSNFGPFYNDTAWLTAVFSSICSAIALAIGFLFASIEYCCVQYFSSRFWIALFFLLASTAQGLTLVMLETDGLCSGGRECKLELGAILSVVAMLMYFVSAIVVCATPKPIPLCKQDACCNCCSRKKSAKEQKGEEVDEETGGAAAVAVVTQQEQPIDDEKDLPNEVDEETGNAAVVVANEEINEDEPADDENKEYYYWLLYNK